VSSEYFRRCDTLARAFEGVRYGAQYGHPDQEVHEEGDGEDEGRVDVLVDVASQEDRGDPEEVLEEADESRPSPPVLGGHHLHAHGVEGVGAHHDSPAAPGQEEYPGGSDGGEDQEEVAGVEKGAGDVDDELSAPGVGDVSDGDGQEHGDQDEAGPHVADGEGVGSLDLSGVEEREGHAHAEGYRAQGLDEGEPAQVLTRGEHLPEVAYQLVRLDALAGLDVLEVAGHVYGDGGEADELDEVEGPDALDGDAAREVDEDPADGGCEDGEELTDRGANGEACGPSGVGEAIRDDDVLHPEYEGHGEGAEDNGGDDPLPVLGEGVACDGEDLKGHADDHDLLEAVDVGEPSRRDGDEGAGSGANGPDGAELEGCGAKLHDVDAGEVLGELPEESGDDAPGEEDVIVPCLVSHEVAEPSQVRQGTFTLKGSGCIHPLRI